MERLGGRCTRCGKRFRLELDHIEGRDWDLERKSRWQRVRIYLREEREGKLQVLCRRCNAKKGKPGRAARG